MFKLFLHLELSLYFLVRAFFLVTEVADEEEE